MRVQRTPTSWPLDNIFTYPYIWNLGASVRDHLKEPARLFADLGHPMRLRILCILSREGRQCVCRMLEEVGVPQPTLSRHLGVLRGHGYIEDEREGTLVFYRIADARIRDLLAGAGLPCGCAQTDTKKPSPVELGKDKVNS